MPFEMDGCVQSVVVEGTVYVGGGNAGFGSDIDYIVMTYDISTGKWSTLPPYRAREFAMTAINNQLVLVGGCEHGRGNSYSKLLGVWDADNKQWTHPYPEMHTAHLWCSVVVHNEWLVVAGGWSQGAMLSSVEVMNTNSKQWYAGPSTPIPWDSMKTATVGDECYFMGGGNDTGFYTNTVYSVSLSALTTGLNSSTRKGTIWKEISGLQTTHSTPLSISGSLLAVGGSNKDIEVVTSTAIHLYQPDTGEWVKVGDLPTPRYSSTCTMIADRELIVTGGCDGNRLKWMDIALIK